MNVLDKRMKALITYGSHANGTNDEYSDIDICVVIDDYNRNDSDAIKNIVSKCEEKNYFILAVDSKEFQETIQSGDPFYRNEIITKGEIIYDDDYLIGVMSKPIDFKKGEILQKKRYGKDKEALDIYLQESLEGLKWSFTDLIYLGLAKIGKHSLSLEEKASMSLIPELRFKSNDLIDFIKDSEKLCKLNKDYQHNRIEFPMDELPYYYNRLNELSDVINSE